MLGQPCKNPNCKSEGEPHPNCRCYGMAEGGTVKHFCESKEPHKAGCQYFAEGGFVSDTDFKPDSSPSAPQSGQFIPDSDFKPDSVSPDNFEAQANAMESKNAELKSKYGGAGQQAIAGAEAIGKGLAGPLATGAEIALGVPKEDIRGRGEANPVTSMAGQVAGLVSPVGQGTVLGKVGATALKGAERLVPRLVEKGVLKGITRGAIKLAAENAVYQSSDEVSKMILSDPNQSMGSAISNIGLAAVIGAGAGGVLGSVNPLWKASMGSKAGGLVSDFKARMREHLELPTPKDPSEIVTEPHFIFSAENPKVTPKISMSTEDVLNHLKVSGEAPMTVQGHYGSPETSIVVSHPKNVKMLSKLAEDLGQESGLWSNGVDHILEYYNGPQSDKIIKGSGTNWFSSKPEDFYTQIGDKYFSHNLNFEAPESKLHHYTRSETPLTSIKPEMQGTGAAGKESSRVGRIPRSYYYDTPVDHESIVTQDAKQKYKVISPGKILDLASPEAEAVKDKSKNIYGIFEPDKLEETIKNAGYSGYKNSNGSNPNIVAVFKTVPTDSINQFLNKTYDPFTGVRKTGQLPIKTEAKPLEDTLGAKLADMFIKHADSTGAKMLSTSIGATLGHMTHIPYGGTIGAILGEKVLSPVLESVLPVIARPIMEKALSSEGMKAAVDYSMNVVKGEQLSNNAVKRLFESGSKIIPDHKLPDEKTRMKLDKAVQQVQVNPSKLAESNSVLGHYMPDHSVALGGVLQNVTGLLNSLRPQSQPRAPLDPPVQISEAIQAQYDRVLDIAQQPLIVLDAIKNNTITSHDVIALQKLYPALYEGLKQKMMNQIVDHVSTGEQVPYDLRLGMSLFMGQPLDSTMQPDAIMSAQPMPEQGPQQAQPGKKVSQAAGSKLIKGTKSMQTAAQASEAIHSSGAKA